MDFLLRPASLILVMLLAFILRAAGIFTEVETHGVTKVALTITIPAAILCSFENFQRDMQLVWVSAVMLSLVALAVLLSWFLYRKQGNTERIFAMINNGYNIGSFALPIIQNFYGPSGVLIACMADLGNAIMVNGGSYAMTVSLVKPVGKRYSMWYDFLLDVGKRLLHSPPFVRYLVLIPCIILNLRIPSLVVDLLQPVSAANSFLCMSMVGLSIGTRIRWKDCCSLFPLLIQRLLYAALTAAGVYFLSPFSQEIRQILACICFTPLPGLVVINTGYCHGDVERSGLLASLSILMGTVCVLTLAVIFQQI